MSNSNQKQDHQGFGQKLIPQFTKQSVCPVTFFKLAYIYLFQQNKQTKTHTTWQTVVLQVCSVSSKYTVLGESAQTSGNGSLPTITTTDFRGHLTQSVSVLFWGTARTKIYPQKINTVHHDVPIYKEETSNLLVLGKHWTVKFVWEQFSQATSSQQKQLRFQLHINISCCNMIGWEK